LSALEDVFDDFDALPIPFLIVEGSVNPFLLDLLPVSFVCLEKVFFIIVLLEIQNKMILLLFTQWLVLEVSIINVQKFISPDSEFQISFSELWKKKNYLELAILTGTSEIGFEGGCLGTLECASVFFNGAGIFFTAFPTSSSQ
jgi:hypothetical protein